ncbi:MAG: CHAT domain-containing protein [Microcoleaceae cyanobacterium]
MKQGIVIALLIFLAGFTAAGLTTENPKNFTELCLQRDQLSNSEQHTVEVLVEIAGQKDCQAANEQLLKLTQLDLSDRRLSNLKPLSSLTQLQSLRLNQNQITDISPLSSLVNLTKLYLADNQIVDIQPIVNFENLETLYLDNNQIQDLSPISNLESLQVLYGNGNQIETLAPIRNLSNLTELYLDSNKVADTQPLESLHQLTHLNLGNNQIINLESIASLDRLLQLSVNGNQISRIDSLSNLKNLTTLDLRDLPIPQKTCPVYPATICLFSDDAAERYEKGQQEREQGEFTTALKTFEAALQVYRNVGHTLRESDALDQIGIVYDEKGEYAKALDYYQQAAAIRESIGDRQGQSETLTYQGVTYIRIGQTEKAVESLEKALEIYQGISQELSNKNRSWLRQNPPESRIFSNLTLAYSRLGDQPKALQFAKQSLASARINNPPSNNRREEIIALNRVGEAYLKTGNLEMAQLYLDKAFRISQEQQDNTGIARSLKNLGDLSSRLGKTATALEQYQQARDLQQNDPAAQGETLNALGTLLLEIGQSYEASTALKLAVNRWETLRPGLTDADKISIAEIQAQTYRLLQHALIDLGDVEAALEISERGRARAFIELLAHRLALQGQAAPSDRVQQLTVTQIQQIAQEQNATLVEYSLIGKEIYIWVIEPTGKIHFRSRPLAQDSKEKPEVSSGIESLATLVESSRLALDIPGRGNRTDDATIVFKESPENRDRRLQDRSQKLQQLYRLLMQPIADLLPTDGKTTVIIIPQGELFLVPFAALPDENGTDLIEKHALLYSPAISLLAIQPPQRNPLQVGQDSALVVGNPTMPDDPATGAPLEALSGAEEEAREIANLLNTQPLIGEAATKTAVLSKLKDAAIAHFATHGLLDDFATRVPGALALTPTSDDSDSGFLTAAEILTLPLQARLVVLSACDTGRGQITGDGVVGLSRSFLTAGVESVIVSLWSVPDAPTAQLMTEFYRQLQKNPNRAAALRQAMLATRDSYPDQPSSWAAFSLFSQGTEDDYQ